MNNIQIEEKNNSILNILKGLICSFIITLVSIFILSIILTYSNISESIIPVVIIILSIISIFIGTMISVKSLNKNGMLNGLIIGGTYVTSLFLISSLISTGFNFNIYTILIIVLGTMSGIIGGIIGVNI